MSEGILGRKVAMTAIFTEDGRQLGVTVVDVGGNKVVGKRTEERDGYTALILGFGDKPKKRMNSAACGVFAKGGLFEERDGKQVGKRFIREFRLNAEALEGFELGQVLLPETLFSAGEKVDVVGTSKGRGFTGVMRRHNFKGAKSSHGVHEYFRHGGSIGMADYPSRTFKNKKMPGQHGNARITVQNVEIVRVMQEEGLILLRGGVPGRNGGLIRLQRPAKARRQ